MLTQGPIAIRKKVRQDSKSNWKMTARSAWTLFQIVLMPAVICIWRISYGNEIAQYLQKYKCCNVDQDHSRILESSHKTLQKNIDIHYPKMPGEIFMAN